MYCVNGRGVSPKLELDHFELIERVQASMDRFNLEMEQFLKGEVLIRSGNLEAVKM